MNRLTAIGLASLVAYGVLIATKYTGVVSAAREDRVPVAAASQPLQGGLEVAPPSAEPRPTLLATFPAPVARTNGARTSGIAAEFRASRDLKAFADGLSSRGAALTADERYHLAKALEECQFTTAIHEDLAAYSAKQKRQFISALPTGDALNEKRIAAYEAVDNTQRCLGFQNANISPKDVEAMYRAAALQGDARAQARLVTAELNKNLGKNNAPTEASQNTATKGDDFSKLIELLDSRDPEALLYVGQFLAQNAVTQQLRVGPNNEVPEPSAFLGGFSLVACDIGQDCTSLHRDLQQACAYGAYCNAQSFEELYQNFLASPWAYSQAMRYRMMIRTALDNRNYALIGLTPKLTNRDKTPQ